MDLADVKSYKKKKKVIIVEAVDLFINLIFPLP